MLYRALRAVAGVALRWYYGEVVVRGADRIPRAGPVLIASNHPNALVDALVVGTTVRRRVLLTAKATLFEHRLLAALLRAVGVVPLRRAKDERAAAEEGGAPGARNSDAFRAVTEALRAGGVVLVFPEGISHDEPALAPLKTGTARMALAAAEAGARGLVVVPFGITFEAKERHRSRVLVRVGEPIDVDAWRARSGAAEGGPGALTADVDAALRRVTLNFASEPRARRAVALARALASIVEEPPSLGRPRDLALEAELAARVDAAADALDGAPPDVVRRADQFIARVDALEARLAAGGAAIADVRVSPALRHGARFVAREAAVAAVGFPVAALGRATHWLPLRVARALAMRPLAGDPSRDQPAMRTIVLGAACLLVWYLALGVLASRWLGAAGAALLVAAAFAAAGVDFAMGDRTRRAWRRARTYLALRADPALRAYAVGEMRAVLDDASTLERALGTENGRVAGGLPGAAGGGPRATG